MKDFIASAATGWNGTSPRFILIQAQPWQGVTPTSFLNVKNSLDASTYVVVRPDNWFQLLRQANGLPIEPIAPIANGSYRVVNKASGKCVQAAGGITTNGTAVQQNACNGDNAQIWQFTATGNGYYKVVAANDSAQGWDVNGGPSATGDGVKIIVQSNIGGTNQQWQPVWEPGDSYHLIVRHSDKCLDVPGASTADGEQLQQFTCNGAGAQAFQIVSPTAPPPDAMPPPPPPDAMPGTPDAAPGAPDAGGPPLTGQSGGCGCSVGGADTMASGTGGLLAGTGLLLLLALVRTRRGR